MSSHAFPVRQAGLITLGEQIEAVRRVRGPSRTVNRARTLLAHPMGAPVAAWWRERSAPATTGSPGSIDLTEAIPSTAEPATAGQPPAGRAGIDRAAEPLAVGEVTSSYHSAIRGPVDGPAGGRVDGQAPGPADDEKVALVTRARRGDRDAFGQLYDRYADLVFRYALYRVSGDPAAAEDIVSETFLRAFRTITDFRWQGRDIGAWFITIARNLLVDQARSARSRFEFPTADILAAADHRDAAAAVPGPEESVLAVATRRELWEAVRGLRPDQQECVALRFLEGLSVRETALAMGRNEGAVRALQFRAIRTLARSLPALDTG